MNRIILHLDMNSYFASVEQQANPHLRGRPVGVCEHLGGIIIAPSVEAKRLGITLGTPTWEALKKCPEIILLHTDPEKYRSVTYRFMRILSDYTDEVERYSIDEAFFPHSCKHKGEGCLDACYDDALLLALEIKQRMRQEIGKWVSCSIGIGPNKLVSKIAADLDGGALDGFWRRGAYRRTSNGKRKTIRAALPSNAKRTANLIDRICVIKPNQIGLLYDVLKLTDIPGIGERTRKRLNKLGIFELKQLAEYPMENLINQFGVTGYFLHQISNFNNPPLSPLNLRGEFKGGYHTLPKSIGHMYTLPKATKNLEDLKKLLMKLSEKVGRRLRKKKARAGLVRYFHSDKKYHSFHKQRKLPEYIHDSPDIYKYSVSILKQNLPLKSPIKIVGISVGGLDFTSPPEPLLERFKKPVWTTRAADEINDKYGEFTVFPARMLDAPDEWGKDTIGFSRAKT